MTSGSRAALPLAPPSPPRRQTIVEGTREGLAAARARGVRLGRPPAMTPEQVRHARDLLTHPNNTVSSIARLLGVSRSTIYKYVPELGHPAAGATPTLDTVLAALPADTRPPPDVTKYDALLPSREPPTGGR
ncbi:helix-turn-helix domain-containing protein [Pseudonocardia sp. ICBG1034]|uniref:helix-turn-helix domain-containing protein n=1 Tax=Pseudonocardia sp. ICBG1034 TaxID=2844381 RepID=UPI00272E5B58|nr:helix-turn-helix domain-containing protein [Pseudonocardia sp. ICBG1034]